MNLIAVSELHLKTIQGTIIDTGVSTKFTDIIGMSDAKKAIYEAIILPIINPELFKGIRHPCKGILLYGPPGNGKTRMAQAIATECGNFTFFNISGGILTNKYFGDTEKLVQALFFYARIK